MTDFERFLIYGVHTFYRIREGGGSGHILYIILNVILWRFRFNINFSKIFLFCDFTSDSREMVMFRPMFGNFDENQTRGTQTSDISF